MKARRHDLTSDRAALNERLARRSARLNDLEAERLEAEIGRAGQYATAAAAGVSLPCLDGARHSGASTPTTIAALRAFLEGRP